MDIPEAAPEITAEQRQTTEAWLAAHPYGEQDENGIDLSNIRSNLRLTPTERLARLQSAANSMIRLRNAIARN
ncbi:MAG: hypothetical protein H7145_07555 [Akkermansiaceae bacterium]|nr:hypothetical protein [Armatimonadota bacterium]